MIKFLKRLLLFVIVTFIAMNALVFFILNSQTIQHAIVEYINVNYLEKSKLKLSLGSLSLNFFTGSLNLNEVYIKEIKNKVDASKQLGNFNFGLNQLTISFDILASYFRRTPVIKKITLRGGGIQLGYDDKNKLILPDFLQMEDDNEPINIPKILQDNITKIPFSIEGINISFILGKEINKNYQKITLSHIEIEKELNKSGIPILKNSLLVTDTTLVFPFLLDKVYINHLESTILLGIDGSVYSDKFELKSNLAELNTDIRGHISSNLIESTYIANIGSLKLNAKDIFHLLEMDAKGIAVLSGAVVSGKNLFDEPIFDGRVVWKDFKLMQFDIYNGNADLHFKDRSIVYSKAKIKTHKNGNIYSQGKFELFDSFNFENEAQIDNLSFAELLNGLGASFTPVDFGIFSDKMLVTGKIMSPNEKKVFELTAIGSGSAKNMLVTTFKDNKERPPLPTINFNLNLSASVLGLVLDNTNGFIAKKINENSGNLNINSAYIDFTPAKGISANASLTGKDLNLNILEYFLKFKTLGIGDFSGNIKVDPGSTNVVFKGLANASNGEMFGVEFSNYSGEVGLDNYGIWTKNAFINFKNKNTTEDSILKLNSVDVEYDNLNSKIEASGENLDLNSIIEANKFWIKPAFYSTKGKVKKFSTSLSGLIMHPSTWTLKMNSSIENLEFLNGKVQDSKIILNCKIGICANSVILFNNIQDKIPDKNVSGKGASFAFFELNNFSFDNSGFKGKVNNFPISALSTPENTLTGKLNANLEMAGKWHELEGNFKLLAADFSVNNSWFGDISLVGKQKADKNFSIDFSLYNNQIVGNYLMPRDLEQNSILNIKLINFDATNLLNDNVRVNYNLFSQFNGAFNFQGPLGFDQFKNEKWYQKWVGNGSLNSGHIQVGRMLMDINTTSLINFNGKSINLNTFQMNGQIGKVEIGKSNFNIENKYLNTSLNIDANLNKIDQLHEDFGSSEGNLKGQFILDGYLSDLTTSGSIILDAKTLFLKNYQPAFTNLYGKFEFNGNKLELNSFYAEKGTGYINGAGSIDFSKLFSENPESPDLFFKLSAQNVDLRVPVPIIQVIDTTFDAGISISGNSMPYNISGDVTISKFRIFKDIGCDEITRQLNLQNSSLNTTQGSSVPIANLNINFQALNSLVIQTQCVRGKFSTSPTLHIAGDTTNPVIVGNLTTDRANLFLLKSRFDVKRADFNFIELQKYDPNIDIQMESRVASYTILANLNGRFSRPKIDLSIIPPNLPNGDRMTEFDIISIISTGQIPAQSSSANLLSASTNVFFSFGDSTPGLGVLNSTVNTVTAGLFDNVNVVPTSQNGQYSWRVTASRSVAERFNLGVSYQGQSGDAGASPSPSFTADYFLNDVISLFSSYSMTNSSTSSTQQQSLSDYTGGLRFRFGSQ
ncbi:hypothetical protein QEJ31_08490 [Pigmentibacter sp. JX0631]|uniref:translocation/assembly module TamB domain-containing protein n=1 Tax=Pigmentibacter sp. JX0631 TaxID=2976982 RepID=UPI0024692E3B|nr:hypothetical protein [Pigmentibacter sp. JX0631]WGL58573.1 hypothetical protein QEJ31_08490 [Pigmentibacter sp. JX0631]